MKRLRFPTMPGLILISFALVALPLLASLLLTVRQVDELVRTSRLGMLAIQIDTSNSRALLDRALSIERSARQYLATQDAAFKAMFDVHRDHAMDQLKRLERPHQDLALVAELTTTRWALNDLAELIETGEGGDSATLVTPALERLHQAVEAVVSVQSAAARLAGDELLAATERLQRSLVWQAALVIPVSLVLAAVLFSLITTPLRRIGRTIHALGRGDLGARVEGHGTRDLQLLCQRLEWLRTRLVDLEAQKSQFLRNVSHELKTPLTNIREGAELLTDGGADCESGEQAEVAGIVRDNSIRLQSMIEALLRHGAEADQSAGEVNQEVALDELVRDLIERQVPAAQARSVTIDHALEPVRRSGNARRLQVIVDNLLSNALNHTPPGGRIEVRLHSSPAAITLDVKDTGPGVPETARERIFDWFYTRPRSPGAPVSGSGIGLAIAQEYAEQHGGRILLLPSEEGAHFRLVLNAGEAQ